jgi:hypothetical protein
MLRCLGVGPCRLIVILVSSPANLNLDGMWEMDFRPLPLAFLDEDVTDDELNDSELARALDKIYEASGQKIFCEVALSAFATHIVATNVYMRKVRSRT